MEKHGKSRICSSRKVAEISAFHEAKPLQTRPVPGTPMFSDSRGTGSHRTNTCEGHKEIQPGFKSGACTKNKSNPGSFKLLSCGFHPRSSNSRSVPSALQETLHRRVREARGTASLWGGFFVFIRNNNINHNIKQKPLRGRIPKLTQHRAQPTADLPASGRSRQLPWDLSMAAEATGALHMDGGSGKQIQEDGCRNSSLEMLVLTLSG